VLGKVRGIHTHSRASAAFRAVSHSRWFGDVFELPTLVDEKKVGHGIVGHKETHVAVVININVASHHSPCFPTITGNSRLLADVGKCPIPVVVKQPAEGGL